MQKTSTKKLRILSLFLCLTIFFSLTSCAYPAAEIHTNNQGATQASANTTPTPTQTPSSLTTDIGFMEVSFLDVGQGDSIFLLLPNGQTMLIDAGNKGDEERIVGYIKEKNVTKLDYVVATHPHADHIGGMPGVLEAFDVGAFYMPKKAHNTQTFEDLLLAIEKKGLKVHTAQADVDIIREGNLSVSFLAPGDLSDSSLNNVSAVTKITYGNRSFLFMGDAEKIAELELLEKGKDVKADVLKVGHHGAETSTTKAFYQKVSPSYAVISCGKGNSYNHPDEKTIATLQSNNAQIFRTDEQGTIIITTDGISITTRLLANVIEPNAPPNGSEASASKNTTASAVEAGKADAATAKTVYITLSGEKYHRNGCSSLSQSKIPTDLNNAVAQGYTPCKRCKP